MFRFHLEFEFYDFIQCLHPWISTILCKLRVNSNFNIYKIHIFLVMKYMLYVYVKQHL